MKSTSQSMPLSELSGGEHAVLLQLGDLHSASNRLLSLGFTPGVEIAMLQNYRPGPLLVNVRGMRVALGRSEAGQILVKPERA